MRAIQAVLAMQIIRGLRQRLAERFSGGPKVDYGWYYDHTWYLNGGREASIVGGVVLTLGHGAPSYEAERLINRNLSSEHDNSIIAGGKKR